MVEQRPLPNHDWCVTNDNLTPLHGHMELLSKKTLLSNYFCSADTHDADKHHQPNLVLDGLWWAVRRRLKEQDVGRVGDEHLHGGLQSGLHVAILETFLDGLVDGTEKGTAALRLQSGGSCDQGLLKLTGLHKRERNTSSHEIKRIKC